jgi:hypothetical protein
MFFGNNEIEQDHWALWNFVVWGTNEDWKKWQSITAKKGYQPFPRGLPSAKWLKDNLGIVK